MMPPGPFSPVLRGDGLGFSSRSLSLSSHHPNNSRTCVYTRSISSEAGGHVFFLGSTYGAPGMY